MKRYVVPQFSWYEDKELSLEFPEEWDVEFHPVPGDRWNPLSADEIAAAIRGPVDSPPLREMARGKQRVVILFDDISRPTPTHALLPPIIEELHAAGVSDDQIQFIVALGAHGAHSRLEFAMKLGADIVERYPVYNHNCYENTVVIGRTSRGNEIAVNAEYWDADLKIGIGAVLPHPYNGFSGSGKIVVPGVANIETIAATHYSASVGARRKGLNPVSGLGKWEQSEMRGEVEEIAGFAGPDFLVQVLTGTRRQVIGVTAGHPVSAYRTAVAKALRAYGTAKATGMDVVVANAGVKSCEGVIALLMGIQSLKENGGDVVVVAHSPMGQIAHYLLGPFGKSRAAGRFCSRGKSVAGHNGRIVIFSPYPSRADGDWFGPADKVFRATTWSRVMDLLGDRGMGTRVAVYEDATMMYFADDRPAREGEASPRVDRPMGVQ